MTPVEPRDCGSAGVVPVLHSGGSLACLLGVAFPGTAAPFAADPAQQYAEPQTENDQGHRDSFFALHINDLQTSETIAPLVYWICAENSSDFSLRNLEDR